MSPASGATEDSLQLPYAIIELTPASDYGQIGVWLPLTCRALAGINLNFTGALSVLRVIRVIKDGISLDFTPALSGFAQNRSRKLGLGAPATGANLAQRESNLSRFTGKPEKRTNETGRNSDDFEFREGFSHGK
jgi:hypothetical protein